MRSHPSAPFLASFATGDLPIPPAITVSAHVDGCTSCRKEVSTYEHAEGRRMELSVPEPLRDAALAGLLARLGDEPYAKRPDAAPKSEFLGDVRLPRAAAHAGFRQRRWLAPGLWAARLNATPGADWQTFLLRAPAGTRIPNHAHQSAELIAVLSGRLSDGRSYDPGDFVENDRKLHHMAVSTEGSCACLISTQGRIRWRGWNRLIGVVLGV